MSEFWDDKNIPKSGSAIRLAIDAELKHYNPRKGDQPPKRLPVPPCGDRTYIVALNAVRNFKWRLANNKVLASVGEGE